MRTTTKLIIICVAGTLFSCNNSTKTEENKPLEISYAKLENASWILGTWQNKSPEGIATESWNQENDSTYSGSSYFVINKDTVSSEAISLEQRGEDLFYIPIVKEQNEGKAVKFKLSSASDKELIFENPAHDFPQKITYKKMSNDSIVAEISGKMEGKYHAQLFPMSKVK